MVASSTPKNDSLGDLVWGVPCVAKNRPWFLVRVTRLSLPQIQDSHLPLFPEDCYEFQS
jgi:hypothetical protein